MIPSVSATSLASNDFNTSAIALFVVFNSCLALFSAMILAKSASESCKASSERLYSIRFVTPYPSLNDCFRLFSKD
ncbi:hypothetical protein [Staphylococcus kloosii]|uniref:hypothetical protein n=1 Tax=Staphylococcus kloosii TaxID=29384 RepID=UPI001E2B7AE2|nr:hypothetical protein [Staphylococcus kloosii]